MDVSMTQGSLPILKSRFVMPPLHSDSGGSAASALALVDSGSMML